MNVLFYIDPHIIRENPLEYWPIASRLYKTLFDNELDIKKPTKYNFNLLLTKIESPEQPFIVKLPEKIARELMRFNCTWDEKAIEQWELMMRGEGIITEIYCDILYYLMKEHSIDVFIYWGSNHTVRKFADSFNIYSFAMEFGPTRKPFPETAYFDPLGVNGDAYSSGLCVNDFPGCDINLLCYSLPFVNSYFCDAYLPIQSKNAVSIYSENSKILIPLQLDDDSNCILHSDHSGMEDMLREVVLQLIRSNHTVFIKPHPGAHPSVNIGGARKINVESHQRCKDFIENELSCKNAVWLDDVGNESYLSLLNKIDVVLTVNSSVGFEAMLLGKPVVTLGRAPYNISNSLPTFKDLKNREIDMEDYKQVAGKIANIMLNYYLYPIDILDDLSIMSRALDRGIAITDQYRFGGQDTINHFVRNNPINFVN